MICVINQLNFATSSLKIRVTLPLFPRLASKHYSPVLQHLGGGIGHFRLQKGRRENRHSHCVCTPLGAILRVLAELGKEITRVKFGSDSMRSSAKRGEESLCGR